MEKQFATLTLDDDDSDGVYDRTADLDGDLDLDDEFLGDDDDDLDVEEDSDVYASDVPNENPPPYYPGILTCIVRQQSIVSHQPKI